MPTLTLRTVGMSYLIEGLGPSGLDPRGLLGALEDAYGPAAAPMITPRTAGPADPSGGEPPIDAMIVDRKAVPWEALRAWLEAWVTRQGCVYSSWADDGRDNTAATLHFHL